MTNQVAITMLKNLEQSLDDYCELNDEGKEAFHMAITALELFGNSEQLPSTHSKLEKNSQKLDNENGECNDCIKHGGDWECDRVHCHKGDAISRQTAIAEFNCCELTPDGGIDANYAIEFLEHLPSVQPQKGKWIYGESEIGHDGYYCSKCGNFVPWEYGEYDIDFIKEFLFCNKCGADMREGDAE